MGTHAFICDFALKAKSQNAANKIFIIYWEWRGVGETRKITMQIHFSALFVRCPPFSSVSAPTSHAAWTNFWRAFLPLRISNNLQHRFRLTVWTGLRVSGSPSLSPSPAALSSFSSSLLFSGKFYLINVIILFVQLGAVVPLYVVPSGGQFWHRLCLLNAVEA